MANCQHVNRVFLGHGPFGSKEVDMSTFRCLDNRCAGYFYIPYKPEHWKESGLSPESVEKMISQSNAWQNPHQKPTAGICLHTRVQSFQGKVTCLDCGAPNPKHDAKDPDPVNHPKHYTSHPSGIECIEVTRHMNFNCGNVVKYLWRTGLKDSAPSVQDLEKAKWYLEDEIKRVKQDV